MPRRQVVRKITLLEHVRLVLKIWKILYGVSNRYKCSCKKRVKELRDRGDSAYYLYTLLSRSMIQTLMHEQPRLSRQSAGGGRAGLSF